MGLIDHCMNESKPSKQCMHAHTCLRVAYIKRVIAHPSFHNVDYKKCEKLMDAMEQGDVIIRPSSKVQYDKMANFYNAVNHRLILNIL